MKKVFLGTFIATIVFPFSFVHAGISLTEVAWMGTVTSQFSEWIEIFNDGSSEVDLAGYKLYEGTSTLVFTLTKKIAPGGYYLVERTTASSPDAIPGVDDDAGTWGGGGLSNSGERLLLKDSAGQTIFDLDSTSGWPAGDSATKQTMQWTGSTWATATATPRTATVAVVSQATETTATTTVAATTTTSATSGTSATVTSSSSHSSPVPLSSAVPIKSSLTADAGRNRFALAGTPVQFAGRISRGGDAIIQPHFLWSFGDGTSIVGDEPDHVYEYPGTYNVVLNVSEGTDRAVARTIVRVDPPQISLGSILYDEDAVELVNGLSVEANLGGFVLRSGSELFKIPVDTILAPHQKSMFSSSATRLSFSPDVGVALFRPDGRLVSEVRGGAFLSGTISATSTARNDQQISVAVEELRAKLATAQAQMALLVAERATKGAVKVREVMVTPVVATTVPSGPETEEIIVRVPPSKGGIGAFFARMFGIGN